MPDDPANSFSQTFTVRYDECGPGGTLRASVHMRLLQELAFAHSASLGFPLAWYERHRLFWLVRRANLTVHSPARYGDALVYATRVAGARRVMARRLNTIRRSVDGTLVATALVDWIFTAHGTTPVRVAEALIKAFPAMAQPVAPIPLEERRTPAGTAPSSLRIRVSDADAMGHANNAVYLDLLDDAVVRAGRAEAIAAHPRTYDLQFSAAATVGAELHDLAWEENDQWHYRLEGPDGSLLLHGRLAGGSLSAQAGSAVDG